MKIKLNLEVPAIRVGDFQTTSTTKVEIEIEASLEELELIKEYQENLMETLDNPFGIKRPEDR